MVFSSTEFNSETGQTVLAMITTAAAGNWPNDVEIVDTRSAGLDHHSFVRWKMFTLPNQLVLRKVGTLSEGDMNGLRRSTRSSFPACTT